MNRNNILGPYLLIILSIFAFVTYPGSIDITEDPVVWYMHGLPVFYAAAVSIIAFIIILINHTLVVDKAAIWLFIRLFVCLIPITYVNSIASFSSHYPVVILTLIAYCIGRASSWEYERQIGKIVIAFGIVLCFQVIATFRLIPIEYFNLLYKNYMRIPIAASNVIAAYIVPIFFLFIFNYKPQKIIKIIIATLFVVAIILTKSRGGVAVLTLTYITYLTLFKYKFSLKNIIAIGLLFGLIIYFLLNIPEVKLFMLGFSADNTAVDANSLSSNRLNIFGEEFERFLNHPLFGNGMIFNQNTSKSGSHNLIIELLVQSGVLGSLCYIIPMIIVIKTAYGKYKYTDMLGWTIFLIATIYHGMIEVNFFNYSTDIIFWSICGLIMCNKRGKMPTQINSYDSNKLPQIISSVKQ